MSTLVQHSMTHFNIFFPKPASPLPRFLYECMYVFRPLLVKFYNFVAVFIYNECVWLLGFEMWTCVWVLFDMCVSFEFFVSVFTTDQRQQKPAGIPVFLFLLLLLLIMCRKQTCNTQHATCFVISSNACGFYHKHCTFFSVSVVVVVVQHLLVLCSWNS